jgi:hypothetical protein
MLMRRAYVGRVSAAKAVAGVRRAMTRRGPGIVGLSIERRGRAILDHATELDTLLLPPATRLVHIGPPKTGTTSLQSAFHARRDEVEAQGVRYAGASRHSAAAILAVTGKRSPYEEDGTPSLRRWHALVREIRRAGERRVVLSSEYLAGAKPEAIRTVVQDLAPAQVHVVVTLRPLAALMPSQWQQYVQGGFRPRRLADAMLNQPGSRSRPRSGIGTATTSSWRDGPMLSARRTSR